MSNQKGEGPTPYDPNADFQEPEHFVDRSVASGGADDAPIPQRTGGLALTSTHHLTAFNPGDTEELKSLIRVIVKGGTVPEGYLMPHPEFPNDWKKRVPDMSKMAVGILAGRERGMPPITALMSIMIVRGMPSVWGLGAKGLVYQSNKVEDYRLTWIDLKTYVETMDPAEVAKLEKDGYVILVNTGGRTVMAKPMQPPGYDVNVDKWPNELCAFVTGKRAGVTTPFVGRYSVGHARRQKLWMNPKKAVWMQNPEDMLEHRAASRVWNRGFSDCLMGLALMDPAEETPQHERVAADTSFLGAPTADVPVVDQGAQERDLLLGGLSKCANKEQLETWFQAAGGRVEWLKGSHPEHAEAVNAAYMAKLKEFTPEETKT